MRVHVHIFKTISLAGLITIVLASGCAKQAEKPIDPKNMDMSVKPGDNFFRYVNGGWLDRTEIPADKVSYNAIDIIRENRDKQVYDILEEVAKITDAEQGSITQKISDFYFTGMDTAKIEADGITPLQPEFDRIDKLSTKQEFQDLVARFHTYGLDPLFEGGIEQDFMNSSVYKFYLMQAGIGLPDRDYYTKQDDRSKEIRTEYVKHVAKMFTMMGIDSATANANAATVMQIETKLAENSKTQLEMRDIPALYNKMSLENLSKLAPNFNWQRYFSNISDQDFGDVIVGMPKFFKEVSVLVDEAPLDDWKIYMRWNLLNRSAEYLSDDFVNEDYKFYSEFLSGSKQIQDRWKRVVQTTNGSLGEPLGQLYVEKYFPPESKQRMLELVNNLKKALKLRIEHLEWMSEPTKQAALAKLSAMRTNIGYPDKWEDYSKLEIQRDSYISNVRRANYFNYYKDLERFGKPVDREKWIMTPQTVNAGYHPIRNDITFPAGILQPPFFNPAADDPVNYGSIGVVIGHEMTHGFDDQGRHFDKDGNMTDWWTKADEEEFNKRTQLLVDQYSGFVALDSVHIDGKLSLGENIADFGGLTVALTAYKMSLEGKPAPQPIDGFTDMQRFFIGHAQIWRGKIRDKALLRKVQEDVHPWGEYRINGALFNMPEFYASFEISPNDKLYRTEVQRPVIW
ncbi:M13 family metallopeptidase [candidate division KSB1 bacterium]|nr:M13 family metallopeptidase [candidate division KSB1 bacterium]